MNHKKMPRVALGAWSWGAGMAGGDQVFGNHLTEEELKPVFASAMQLGLNLWDMTGECCWTGFTRIIELTSPK